MSPPRRQSTGHSISDTHDAMDGILGSAGRIIGDGKPIGPVDKKPVTVFVSGCYDIITGGHIEFFRRARALGDRLIVSIASDDVLWRYKHRTGAMPVEHKLAVISALECVDQVVVSDGQDVGLNFAEDFRRLRPDILAVQSWDDKWAEAKKRLCHEISAQYVAIPDPSDIAEFRVTQIYQRIRAPIAVPLRVDFAGGWLDVPSLARPGARIVNCTISPLVSLKEMPYVNGCGLGGSAAMAILEGKEGVKEELAAGVGWQDPAILTETGLCVWRSGPKPKLELKQSGDWLLGRMAVWYTGQRHTTADLVDVKRDYARIASAADIAANAVRAQALEELANAIRLNYSVQLDEGMNPLPLSHAMAWKYAGAGHGGYALYLFDHRALRDEFVAGHDAAMAVDPYDRWGNEP